ncbi:MAG: hypothetical protein IKQ33_06835 [Clostridia bacterium]|nr:hypothetical protein [Clostridia bacterium]
MEAAAQDIAIHAGMDISDFEAGKDLIQSYTQDGVAFDDIEVGAFLDDANFIQGLNEMINATDMRVQ